MNTKQMINSLLTIGEASKWATSRLGREVTPSNLSYLVNYGRIPKIRGEKGAIIIDIKDLESYYDSRNGRRETQFKKRLGNDLNWRLSFEEYKESETTKHVHRLHPYKGKFIPQLVEYFLDSHTDEFKSQSIFNAGDIVLDPFCGSGTTLVQANELGMHAVGVEVSRFNTMISNLKLCRLPSAKIAQEAGCIEEIIKNNPIGMVARNFEAELLAELKKFNCKHFPVPEYKRQVREGKVDEDKYGEEKARLFLPKYKKYIKKFNLQEINPPGGEFMDTWYFMSARQEIDAAAKYIEKISNPVLRGMMRLILSRTIRSSRATTHADLATLHKPVYTTYYCAKHGKICKPLFSILSWWRRYSQDAIKRLAQFEVLRTDTKQICITGDSRKIDLSKHLAKNLPSKKVRGIFSSPPYVGLINYHEQHAYAYELFDLPRNEQNEIGILEKGVGKIAREDYVCGIADVLVNCRRFMQKDFDVFLVANDKFGLYPHISERAGMQIINEYKRPVINRAEGMKSAYGESIFHMRRR